MDVLIMIVFQMLLLIGQLKFFPHDEKPVILLHVNGKKISGSMPEKDVQSKTMMTQSTIFSNEFLFCQTARLPKVFGKGCTIEIQNSDVGLVF